MGCITVIFRTHSLTHQPWPKVNDVVGMQLAIIAYYGCSLALSYTRKERTLIQVLPACPKCVRQILLLSAHAYIIDPYRGIWIRI